MLSIDIIDALKRSIANHLRNKDIASWLLDSGYPSMAQLTPAFFDLAIKWQGTADSYDLFTRVIVPTFVGTSYTLAINLDQDSLPVTALKSRYQGQRLSRRLVFLYDTHVPSLIDVSHFKDGSSLLLYSTCDDESGAQMVYSVLFEKKPVDVDRMWDVSLTFTDHGVITTNSYSQSFFAFEILPCPMCNQTHTENTGSCTYTDALSIPLSFHKSSISNLPPKKIGSLTNFKNFLRSKNTRVLSTYQVSPTNEFKKLVCAQFARKISSVDVWSYVLTQSTPWRHSLERIDIQNNFFHDHILQLRDTVDQLKSTNSPLSTSDDMSSKDFIIPQCMSQSFQERCMKYITNDQWMSRPDGNRFPFVQEIIDVSDLNKPVDYTNSTYLKAEEQRPQSIQAQNFKLILPKSWELNNNNSINNNKTQTQDHDQQNASATAKLQRIQQQQCEQERKQKRRQQEQQAFTKTNKSPSERAPQENNRGIMKNRSVKWTCCVCTQSFKRACHLEKHAMVFHGESHVFDCTQCEKSFKRYATLIRHVASTHAKVRKHVCTECNFSFYQKCDLDRHMRKGGCCVSLKNTTLTRVLTS